MADQPESENYACASVMQPHSAYLRLNTPADPSFHEQQNQEDGKTYTDLQPCLPTAPVIYDVVVEDAANTSFSFQKLLPVEVLMKQLTLNTPSSELQAPAREEPFNPALYSIPVSHHEDDMPDWDFCEAKKAGRSCCMVDGFGSSASSINSPSPPHYLDAFGEASPSNITGDVQVQEIGRSLLPKCLRCGVFIHWEVFISGNLCLECSRNFAIAAQTAPRRRKTTVATEARQCANCHTSHTSLWRRNLQGNFNCNACGLYYKMNNVNRPIIMRRDVIKRRQRKGKVATAKKTKVVSQISDSQRNFNKVPAIISGDINLAHIQLDRFTNENYIAQFDNVSSYNGSPEYSPVSSAMGSPDSYSAPEDCYEIANQLSPYSYDGLPQDYFLHMH